MRYPPTNGHPRISIDPQIMIGKPCIRGTRITVELLLTHLSAGDTVEELVEDYPFLAREDVHAALMYAAAAMHPPRHAEAAE